MDKRERAVSTRIVGEVRRARSERGWSQAQLAERLDLSVNYVSLIERAERLPSVEVLVRLATTLGTTVGMLVGELSTEGDPWLAEAMAILRALPTEARPMMIGMLRGALVAPARRAPRGRRSGEGSARREQGPHGDRRPATGRRRAPVQATRAPRACTTAAQRVSSGW
jgi:transcriptional regulator with XRE-family HTH domain